MKKPKLITKIAGLLLMAVHSGVHAEKYSIMTDAVVT